MKILCYVAPNCKNLFKIICKGISNDAEMISLSMYNSSDETNFVYDYYKLFKNFDSDKYGDDDDLDIIARCRLLNQLNTNDAIKHVRLTRKLIKERIDKYKPDLVMFESIDQYIPDVLDKESKRKGIISLGFTRTFVEGYLRISNRGEFNIVKKPIKKETEKILKQILNKTYFPSNLIVIKKNIRKWVIKNWIKNIIKIPYFFILRRFPYSKFNYHYWSTFKVVKKYFLFFPPKWEVSKNNITNNVIKSDKKSILIPLQHVPEATVEYWCDNIEVINYHEYLINIARKLSKNFNILIKEHPGSIGFRNPKIYKELKEINNVYFFPINSHSIDCIDFSDAVLVWTGSIGFEAALRGKPVFTVTNPYYVSGSRFMKINLGTKINKMIDFIEDCEMNKILYKEQFNMFSYLMKSFFKGIFRNDGSFNENNKSHCDEALSLGRKIKELYSFD